MPLRTASSRAGARRRRLTGDRFSRHRHDDDSRRESGRSLHATQRDAEVLRQCVHESPLLRGPLLGHGSLGLDVLNARSGANAPRLPAYLCLPNPPPSDNAAYLGGAHNPFSPGSDPNNANFQVREGFIAHDTCAVDNFRL